MAASICLPRPFSSLTRWMPFLRKPSGSMLPPGGATGAGPPFAAAGGGTGGTGRIFTFSFVTWARPGSSQTAKQAKISGSRTIEARRAFHDIGVILPASLVAATAAPPWTWLHPRLSQSLPNNGKRNLSSLRRFRLRWTNNVLLARSARTDNTLLALRAQHGQYLADAAGSARTIPC